MKILAIRENCRKADVYDFETPSHSYILGNGLVSHNTQEMYSKTVVSGGTGIYYSANSIFIIGRQQEKDDNGLSGFNFVVNIEKSRGVREKKKISITVHYGKGINRWSGLLDIAMESGHVIKPKNGWYAKVNKETGEVDTKNYREAQTNCKEFWMPIIEDPSFEEWINANYGISQSEMVVSDEDIDVAVSDGDELDLDLIEGSI